MDDEEPARRGEKTKKKGRDGGGWARDVLSLGEGPRGQQGVSVEVQRSRFRDRDMYIVRERQ